MLLIRLSSILKSEELSSHFTDEAMEDECHIVVIYAGCVLLASLSLQFCEVLLFGFHDSCTNELTIKGIDPNSSFKP